MTPPNLHRQTLDSLPSQRAAPDHAMYAFALPALGSVRYRRQSGALSKSVRQRYCSSSFSCSEVLLGNLIQNSKQSKPLNSSAARIRVDIRCDDSESIATSISNVKDVKPVRAPWMTALHPGAVVEVWSQGELRFAIARSLYAKGVIACFVEVSPSASIMGPEMKVSFGEIVNVWPASLEPNAADNEDQLARDVDRGLQFLKSSQPRSLDLLAAYEQIRRLPKNNPEAVRSSAEIAKLVFPMKSQGSRARNAAVTIASAILVATNTIRFKRAGAGQGWRALPPSVAVARGRCSFVDACKGILDQRSSRSPKRLAPWSREHLEILRQLEIFAASGTVARGTAATALEALGYERTDDGAAQLLLDIEYWATGTVEKHGGGTAQARESESRISSESESVLKSSKPDEEIETTKAGSRVTTTSKWNKAQNVRDWTFPPEILAEARELRAAARRRRSALLSNDGSGLGLKRRNFLNVKTGNRVRVYCIDDKNSRFLDDALSVQVLDNENIYRVATHITDVDQVVKSGSAIDELARERGESLYLPLKPLHMLPASAMDAASFSAQVPTEAISIIIDFDCDSGAICNWEVCASVVPPVVRFNYEQVDAALSNGAKAAGIDDEDLQNIQRLAKVAPLLAKRLDQRQSRRKEARDGPEFGDEDFIPAVGAEERAIASVRLVKRSDRKSANGTIKIAKVVNFQSTGSHTIVGDMLMSAGALLRHYARENRASLPEDKGASLFASRCGTAPLRKYTDLAILRQIKCVLFGRQPAGKRRMDDLRIWLARRHSAGERTVAERRRSALFDSFSSHCSQQCAATGTQSAIVRGKVRTLNVTRKGILRVDVNLDGTGLSTSATISEKLRAQLKNSGKPAAAARMTKQDGSADLQSSSKASTLLTKAWESMPPGSRVTVRIVDVDTAAERIVADIVSILNRT